MQLADTPFALAVIVQEPAFLPVTTPADDTVATAVLLELQVTDAEGVAVADNDTVLFTLTEADDLLIDMVGLFTIIEHEADTPFAVAVILVDPVFTATTTPLLFTVATPVFAELQ